MKAYVLDSVRVVVDEIACGRRERDEPLAAANESALAGAVRVCLAPSSRIAPIAGFEEL